MIVGVLVVFVVVISIVKCICLENKCSALLVVMVFRWTDIFQNFDHRAYKCCL
jgi:hypothetical protein